MKIQSMCKTEMSLKGRLTQEGSWSHGGMALKKKSELIAVLLNSNAREDERDDAAIDLAAFDDNDVIEALFAAATDQELQSEMIKGSCGESLASIWIRKRTVDFELLSRLEGTARTEALWSIKVSRSDWYDDFVSHSPGG